jgi:hypothetical protein
VGSGRTELDAVVTVGEVGEGARLVDDTDLRGEDNQNLRDASSDTILTAASWVLMMTDLMSSEVLPASARRWWRMMAASTAVCESAQTKLLGERYLRNMLGTYGTRRGLQGNEEGRRVEGEGGDSSCQLPPQDEMAGFKYSPASLKRTFSMM